MKKLTCSLLTIILGCISSINGVIVETHHFSEITSYANSETLIVLDIDDTLLIPTQMLGCDEWFQYRINKHQMEGKSASQALEQSLAEWEAIRHLTKMEIVESGTDSIVRELQNQGYKVMGLTTQGLALATRSTMQLKANNIDLTLAAPIKEDHYISPKGHGVLYRNGILFTSGTSKGEAFSILCERSGFWPKRIVFINDKATHLADLEEMAEKLGIEFIGLRYAFSDARKAAFRKEIAEFQFAQSTFGHLISDDEAREMMLQADSDEK